MPRRPEGRLFRMCGPARASEGTNDTASGEMLTVARAPAGRCAASYGLPGARPAQGGLLPRGGAGEAWPPQQLTSPVDLHDRSGSHPRRAAAPPRREAALRSDAAQQLGGGGYGGRPCEDGREVPTRASDLLREQLRDTRRRWARKQPPTAGMVGYGGRLRENGREVPTQGEASDLLGEQLRDRQAAQPDVLGGRRPAQWPIRRGRGPWAPWASILREAAEERPVGHDRDRLLGNDVLICKVHRRRD
ncbi:unnamed protein product [Prorocentrum cordatum]|uniref:Uncharacterized protein n=1 Tax=Prorocentrum cordatum TaxID=2364126 RepID=A0ABN9TD66_9DINO|nr:unnamed protein product [Polarella glacialis]